MGTRLLIALVATAALAVFTNVSLADKDAADTHSGVVVSVADGKLTMTNKDGTKEHSVLLAAVVRFFSHQMLPVSECMFSVIAW